MSKYDIAVMTLEAIQKTYIEEAMTMREIAPEQSWQCFKYSEDLKNAAEELKRLDPAEIEIEGGGTTWWHVCSECRTAVNSKDKFCRQCGRRFNK